MDNSVFDLEYDYLLFNPRRQEIGLNSKTLDDDDGVICLDEMELGVQNWREWKAQLAEIAGRGLSKGDQIKDRLGVLRKRVPGSDREIEIRYDSKYEL